MAPWRFGQWAIFCFMMTLCGCAGLLPLLNTQYEGLITQQNLPSGAIIRPPKGYCVNPDLGQSTDTAEFVTLQACSERDGLLAYGVITLSLVADQEMTVFSSAQSSAVQPPPSLVAVVQIPSSLSTELMYPEPLYLVVTVQTPSISETSFQVV